MGVSLSRWRGLRIKIITWSFIPTAMILAAVALVTFVAYQQVTEDLVVGRNRELTRLSASQLSSELGEYSDPLNAVARMTDVTGGVPAAQKSALMRSANRLAVFDAGVVVLNQYGIVTAAEPDRPEALDQDWSSHGYFRQIVRTTGPVYSDIVPEGPGGTSTIVLAVPITSSEGEFQGMVAGMFRLGARSVSAFYGNIVKLRVGESGSAYLVDSKGRLIYHSDFDLIGQDVAREPVVKDVLAGRVGASRARGLDGSDIVAAYAPVPGTPWGLVIQEHWDSLASASQTYGQYLILLLGLGVALPALVVWVGVRRITRPIEDLISGAKAVAGGDFSQKISAHSGDEIEELAVQFNAMASQLRESYAQLERRVADRTRDLAALNAISAVVSESLDLEEVLRQALDKTLEIMGLKCGAAYRIGQDDGRLELVTYRNVRGEFVTALSDQTNDVATSVLVDGVPRPFALTVAEHPDSEMKTWLQQEGIVQVIGVPLVAKGRLVGAIRLGTFEFRALSEDERALLASIGQQVGIAVENARLYEHAEESAAAAERNRLARDLHDAVTQTLFSSSLIAEVLPKLWDRSPDEGRRRLEELRQLTRGALAEMRTLLLELRPATLVETPLSLLVRQLGEATTSRARIPVAVTVEGQCTVAPDVQVALYRIVQEALNNVAKHSGAEQARVRLLCGPSDVQVEIADDGRGFDPKLIPPGHLGVGIMRERSQQIGAVVEIDSQPGAGTRVVVTWREASQGAPTTTKQVEGEGT
jgi:nitrate/nitrite-specific signal transduction histidine kinase